MPSSSSIPVSSRPIPAFVNPDAGSGPAALAALEQAGTFAVERCDPQSLGPLVDRAIAEGAQRVVIAGGAGTVASAAARPAGTDTAIATVTGGSLTCFARDHG